MRCIVKKHDGHLAWGECCVVAELSHPASCLTTAKFLRSNWGPHVEGRQHAASATGHSDPSPGFRAVVLNAGIIAWPC